MSLPTIVLLGDVGVGKSTLVDRVTGVGGLSSNASDSFTKASYIFVARCKRLQIIDTPGSNALADKMQQNIAIAHALNNGPVALILITVRADTRIANTIISVRKYAECFQDFVDLLGVCVTHLDTVEWAPASCLRSLDAELGMNTAVFVGNQTLGEAVVSQLLSACKDPRDVTINFGNVLKHFRIENSSLKVLKCVRDEVVRFQAINRVFIENIETLSHENDRVDLIFEFQAFMTEEITSAQKLVSEANNFTLVGANVAIEAGHIANLTNQLRSVLFDARTLALSFTNGHGVSDLRRCPHCGLVWAKLEGCNGTTACGNRMTRLDVRNDTFAVLGTFTFCWDGTHLQIRKSGARNVQGGRRDTAGVGCGRRIDWSLMAPVAVPQEFRENKAVSVDDVQLIPKTAQASWRAAYDSASCGCHLYATHA